MARFPSLSAPAASLRESVFARVGARIAARGAELFPLHIGDTHRAPPVAARLDRLDAADPALFRYGAPSGEPALLAAIARKCRRKNDLGVDAAGVLVTAGATAAVSAAVRALLDPTDELLVFAPYWPLVSGICAAAGVVPVEVDVTQPLYREPTLDLAAHLAPHVTARTRAIYLITPNNPDGKVLDRAALGAVAAVARAHDLWVIADEVYEDLVYRGEHVSIASLPGMAERTVTIFSFAKSYALAGYRVGYAVGDARVVHAMRKLHNHAVYNVPVALQRAALAAMEEGDAWLSETRAEYLRARDRASRLLAAPHHLPDGGAYLFLDLAPFVDARGGDAAYGLAWERLIDEGVALAPGSQFGAAYARYARLCFTAVPPDRLEIALARLGESLARMATSARVDDALVR